MNFGLFDVDFKNDMKCNNYFGLQLAYKFYRQTVKVSTAKGRDRNCGH